MKKLVSVCIILTICFMAIFIGCKKNGTITYHNQGIIVLVPGCCPSCACPSTGYSIKFYSDTTTFHHISSDISKFGINAGSNFPIKVDADWQPDNSVQGGNYVIITQLKIVN